MLRELLTGKSESGREDRAATNIIPLRRSPIDRATYDGRSHKLMKERRSCVGRGAEPLVACGACRKLGRLSETSSMHTMDTADGRKPCTVVKLHSVALEKVGI